MQIDKKIIGAFVLGIFVVVFVYQAYTIYQIRDVALNNQAAINQIVNFMNAPQQPQGETQPGKGFHIVVLIIVILITARF